MARQALAQQQQLAERNLTDREKAVESMLAPVREALQRTHEQIARIEKERAEAFGALRSSLEAWRSASRRCSARRATWSRPCGGRRCAGSGRDDAAAPRRARRHGRATAISPSKCTSAARTVRCARHDREHAGRPAARRGREDAARCIPLCGRGDRGRCARRRAEAACTGGVGTRRALASKAYWAQFEHSPTSSCCSSRRPVPRRRGRRNSVAARDAVRQHVIIATPTSFVALLKAVRLRLAAERARGERGPHPGTRGGPLTGDSRSSASTWPAWAARSARA